MAEKSLYYQNQKWLLNVNTSLNLVTICLLQNLKNWAGFSKQNLIKTCLRNAMSVTSLENLMRISIDGPPRDKTSVWHLKNGQDRRLAEFLNNKYLKEATERRVLQYAVK